MAQTITNGNGLPAELKSTLWAAADKLRGHLDAAEYKHVVLGLIFLKYISTAFQEHHDRLSNVPYADPEDREDDVDRLRDPGEEEGQQALADSYALEYPLNPAVSLAPPVKPFAELQPPTVAISDLDGDKAVELLSDAGFVL